mmetsp:Transcript_55145/g.118426  ORF Transcript_55145/g.118426 Transcript_55145/m.118426 type:complete len:217 (+) Transcript_55145:2075-2725(+)
MLSATSPSLDTSSSCSRAICDLCCSSACFKSSMWASSSAWRRAWASKVSKSLEPPFSCARAASRNSVISVNRSCSIYRISVSAAWSSPLRCASVATASSSSAVRLRAFCCVCFSSATTDSSSLSRCLCAEKSSSSCLELLMTSRSSAISAKCSSRARCNSPTVASNSAQRCVCDISTCSNSAEEGASPGAWLASASRNSVISAMYSFSLSFNSLTV